MKANQMIALVVAALCVSSGPRAAMGQEAGASCVDQAQVQQLSSALRERNEKLRELLAGAHGVEQRAKDAEAKAAAESASLLAIAEQRNRELVEIAKHIIEDYENRSLDERVGSGEPLTQFYQVALENKLQEFADQIAAKRFFAEKEREILARRKADPVAAPPK